MFLFQVCDHFFGQRSALKVSYRLYIGHRCCTLGTKVICMISQQFSRNLQKTIKFLTHRRQGKKLFGLLYNDKYYFSIKFFNAEIKLFNMIMRGQLLDLSFQLCVQPYKVINIVEIVCKILNIHVLGQKKVLK